MKRNLLALLAAVALLGGCSLTPEYRRPEAPVPATWPEGEAYRQARAGNALNPARTPAWRDFIGDERLRKVIAIALANNRDLRITAMNVQRARALYGIQRAELFPVVDAVAAGRKERVPADLSSDGKARTNERYDVNLGVGAWEIDFFGRIRSLKDRALEEYLASEEARRGARILLVAEVARAYLVMAANLENLQLAKTTFETQKETYFLVNRRFEVGIATELDLRRAQTQVELARRDIFLFTQLAAQNRNALNLLAGSPAAIGQELLPANLADVAPSQEISAGLPSDVLVNRPDILQAEHLLKAANANIGAARAALFPRIALTTSVGTASGELSGLFASGSDTWFFAPQVTLPIFDARLWSALDVTEAEKEIALLQYERAIENAFREVADALAVNGTVGEQVAAQQALVEAAAETFRLSEARYRTGIDSYLSVLDAQRSLYAAQRVLVVLNLEKRANQVQLYAVLGGGGE